MGAWEGRDREEVKSAILRRTRSVAETEALGALLGKALRPADVVALVGPLGAGKTAFVRGIGRGAGSPDRVASPAYTLMAEYAGRLPLYHFDAYFAAKEERFLASGGLEYFHGEGASLVEWADRVEPCLPADRLVVSFEVLGEEERRIRFEALGPRSIDLLREAVGGEKGGPSRGGREPGAASPRSPHP